MMPKHLIWLSEYLEWLVVFTVLKDLNSKCQSVSRGFMQPFRTFSGLF